jgi:hypothetical protein
MDEIRTQESTRSEVDNPKFEAAYGGADAINDTPGIARHGTTPGSPFRVVSPTDAPSTDSKIIWLAVVVVLGIILAYAVGMLR